MAGGAGASRRRQAGGAGASIDARVVLLGRLRARRAEIEQEIFARVNSPWFDNTGSDDGVYVAGLQAAGAAALEYVLVGVERWGDLHEGVPVATIEQAKRAARMGVELDTVLRRYVAGYAVLEGFALREAESDPLLSQGGVLREVLRAVSVLVDRLIVAANGAYRMEVERQVGEAYLEDRDTAEESASVEEDHAPGMRGNGHGGALGGAVGAMRRERILRAFVEVAAERGLADTSVGLVVAGAEVSRRTLYQLFPGGLEDCLLAVLDDTGQRVIALAAGRLEQAGSWQEGVRAVLAALLVFFDREPGLTRVCFVEALAGGRVVVERREAAVLAFRELIVAYVERAAAQDVPALTAESGIASVMGIIHTRLLASEQTRLIELLGPLMGLVMTPVGASEQMVAEEARRGDDLARAIQAGEDPGWVSLMSTMSLMSSPGQLDQAGLELPACLINPSARRARECLLNLAAQNRRGHGPSNREIATGIGVEHKSQISRLLKALLREGLVVKRSGGVGAPNAWRLTARGEDVAHVLEGTSGEHAAQALEGAIQTNETSPLIHENHSGLTSAD